MRGSGYGKNGCDWSKRAFVGRQDNPSVKVDGSGCDVSACATMAQRLSEGGQQEHDAGERCV